MGVEVIGNGCSRGAMGETQVDEEPLRKCGSDAGLPTSASGCFDCNICLDFAVEPVVTLCGHLYCWPCIYKWLQQAEHASLQQAEHASLQQCPVCKASLSRSTLVPLYGRGHSTKRAHQILEDIPRRPSSAHWDNALRELESPRLDMAHALEPPILQHRQQHFHLDGPYYGYPYSDHISPPSSPLRTPTGTRMIHSTAGGVLGGMAIAVLPWVYRNQEATGMYYPSPHHLTGAAGVLASPRLRRQEARVERSLHQIWVFLFCCALLCLVLF